MTNYELIKNMNVESLAKFIKLRKMYDKSQKRLYRIEQELNDGLSLEDLLENFIDKEIDK